MLDKISPTTKPSPLQARDRFPAYLVFGAPGSGKGTQGHALGSIPGFFHCACGDVFRSLDVSTPLGRAFLEHSSKGQLVPDELTIALWSRQIANHAESSTLRPETDTLVLDGIPRNVRQAQLIDEFIDIRRVFYLECSSFDRLVERLKKRAIKDNRLDDANDQVIQRRLEIYQQESAPLLDFYSADQIVTIDSTRPPVEVLENILSHIIVQTAESKHPTQK